MWNLEQFRKDLETVVNIDSGTADRDGVKAVGDFFEDKCKAMGFVTKRDPQTLTLEARSREDAPIDILMLGHMDTVFPRGTVAERPYREEGNLAFGPGVADMKAGLLVMTTLAERLTKEHPELNLCLAFNGEEETGSLATRDWMIGLGKQSRYAFVFEPGRDGGAMVKKRKGNIDLILKFHGVSSHAGIAPEKGFSAVTEMAHWIIELNKLQDLTVGTSVNVGLVKGGIASNVVPDYAECMVDLRFERMEEMEKVQARVAEMAKSSFVPNVTVDVEYQGIFGPMNPSKVTEALIEKTNAKAAELGQTIGWVATGGVSDANHIAALGVPTLCGCGPVGGNTHNQKEFLELDTIEQRLDLFYALMPELK